MTLYGIITDLQTVYYSREPYRPGFGYFDAINDVLMGFDGYFRAKNP